MKTNKTRLITVRWLTRYILDRAQPVAQYAYLLFLGIVVLGKTQDFFLSVAVTVPSMLWIAESRQSSRVGEQFEALRGMLAKRIRKCRRARALCFKLGQPKVAYGWRCAAEELVQLSKEIAAGKSGTHL